MMNRLKISLIVSLFTLTTSSLIGQCPAFSVQVLVTVMPSTCENDDGHACAIVTGQDEMYGFVWSNGYTSKSSGESCVQNLPYGHHFVTIFDQYNCSETIHFTVSDPQCPREEEEEEEERQP